MKLKRHLLTAALTLFCLSAANAQLLRTTVEQGEIEGVEHEGFALYKGIPYAEAPVGNLRWKAPVSKKPWKGVFKADKWGDRPHLFQNRFDRRSLDTDWQVMEAIRSVHADPQEAGVSLIERYPWSSFAEHLRAYDGDAADVARGFSDPSCVLELFGSAEGFIAYSLSTPDGGEPALGDMKETEWERHAFAGKMAKELGVPLRGVKAAPPAQRDTVIFGLHDAGFTVRQIERYTGIGKSTVSRIVRARARTAMRTGGNVM